MFRVIRLIFRDLSHPTLRFTYLSALIRDMPGSAGEMARGRWLPRYFGACGEGVVIQQGIRIKNPHLLRVGRGSVLGADCFLQAGGGITLHDNVLLGPGVKIWSVNHVFRDTTKLILEQGYEREAVVIGEGCWLGANVFVMPGVELPEGCIVAAGSIVGKKKYPPWSILAGYPARVIGNRLSVEPPPISPDEN